MPGPNDPLHGITLEAMVRALVEQLGFERLGRLVPIRCFLFEPSVSSSLKFLRRTPWARARVEELYLEVCVRGNERPEEAPERLSRPGIRLAVSPARAGGRRPLAAAAGPAGSARTARPR